MNEQQPATEQQNVNVDPLVIRPQLQDWFMANMPDEKKLNYGKAAQGQIMWVRDSLAPLIWHSLLPGGKYEKLLPTLTVDGTHRSKSVLLPVYRFDVSGVTIKIRGNFHDWCVNCWGTIAKPFPVWMEEVMCRGYFEGMSSDKAPISFCVSSREQLYAVIWWMTQEVLEA